MRAIILILLLLAPKFITAQYVTTFVGNGISGDSGDGGLATSAKILNAHTCVFDKYENFYFSQYAGQSIRRVDISGVITTIAGTGSIGYSGDGGPATDALFKYPECITVDTSGNVYVSDRQNFRIRKVNKITSIITTIAGNGIGADGPDGVAASASSFFPSDIHFDHRGNLYVSDGFHNKIRKINAAGIISTYAGTGVIGFSGDKGPATSAQFYDPQSFTIDSKDNLYIVDGGNKRVRKIDTFGIITTIAGTGISLYSGDGLQATSTNIGPSTIAVDKYDKLYISDSSERILMIDEKGVVHTITGTGIIGYNGDNITATSAEVNGPGGIAFDDCNNLYFADVLNNRIRKVTFNPEPCTYLSAPQAKNSQAISVYPNPANELLHIDNATANSTYKLMNITGRIQQEGTLKEGSNVIDIPGLYDGVYMISLSPSTNAQGGPGAGGVTKVFKIVVSR